MFNEIQLKVSKMDKKTDADSEYEFQSEGSNDDGMNQPLPNISKQKTCCMHCH